VVQQDVNLTSWYTEPSTFSASRTHVKKSKSTNYLHWLVWWHAKCQPDTGNTNGEVGPQTDRQTQKSCFTL